MFCLLVRVAAACPAAAGVVVGSKNFPESRLLAEIFAQALENRAGLEVERRLNLAGTQICFDALLGGSIDLYPEYTGTGLVSLLGLPPESDRETVLRRVSREFLSRWDLWWLAPLGFENAYELAVPVEVAERFGLQTISDLARVSQGLAGGFGYEFVARPDGLPGLEKTYHLRFGSVRSLQQTLKYRAAATGDIQVLDVYTTDGRLLLHDLRVLEDDLGFFPAYEAAALVRGEALHRHPEIGPTLALLAGAFSEERVRALNLRLQEGGETAASVAAEALTELGLSSPRSNESGRPRKAGVWSYIWEERGPLLQRTLEHLGLAGLALVFGIICAVPLALALERNRAIAEPFIRLLGVTQTIPSIALLAFMVPLFGIGALPALVALWIYSLFPMVRNTYTGIRDADSEAVEAATALGMTDAQVLVRIRLPLAAPVIMAGVRTAAVLAIGTATLAAFIGAGGLGEPIVTGLQLADLGLVLSGAIPAALLAIFVDLLLGGVEGWVAPSGIRQ